MVSLLQFASVCLSLQTLPELPLPVVLNKPASMRWHMRALPVCCAESGTNNMVRGGSVGILQGSPAASSKAPKRKHMEGRKGGRQTSISSQLQTEEQCFKAGSVCAPVCTNTFLFQSTALQTATAHLHSLNFFMGWCYPIICFNANCNCCLFNCVFAS